jgi:predicted Zn-dependent peptidase
MTHSANHPEPENAIVALLGDFEPDAQVPYNHTIQSRWSSPGPRKSEPPNYKHLPNANNRWNWTE